MKLAKIALVATAIVAVSSHLSLAKPNDYRLIAFENCDVVAEHTLDQNQIDAYLALQDSEQRMASLEKPVDALNEKIDRYSSKIGNLTSQAISEDGDMLTIDRALLREQEQAAKELEALVKTHESDFASLEKEARIIEEKAHRFENAIAPLIKDKDYDMVRIVGPKYSDAPYRCDSDEHAMTMM